MTYDYDFDRVECNPASHCFCDARLLSSGEMGRFERRISSASPTARVDLHERQVSGSHLANGYD